MRLDEGERKATFESLLYGQILLPLFLFFFSLPLPPLHSLFLFRNTVPFCEAVPLRVLGENLHVQMASPSSAGDNAIPLARGFASERRKAPISRNVDEEKEKRSDIPSGDTATREKNRVRVDPGDERAPGRRSWDRRPGYVERDGIAIIAIVDGD